MFYIRVKRQIPPAPRGRIHTKKEKDMLHGRSRAQEEAARSCKPELTRSQGPGRRPLTANFLYSKFHFQSYASPTATGRPDGLWEIQSQDTVWQMDQTWRRKPLEMYRA